MRTTTLALVLLSVFCVKAHGNAGVFLGSGHTVQLVQSADVQMVSEDVTITPICGVTEMGHSVDVRCKFVLKNRSDKPVTIQAGFPLDRTSYSPPKQAPDDTERVLSRHFIARDPNRTYHVRYSAMDKDNKFSELFLWDMAFAAGETKTLHVSYLLPMSVAAHSTRKEEATDFDAEPAKPERPWHPRIQACLALLFSYVTETGRSWAGPIENATFRLNDAAFQYKLRLVPVYIGGHPVEIASMTTSDENASSKGEHPEESSGFVAGMKLGTVHREIFPKDWRPKPDTTPAADRVFSGTTWQFEQFKPGATLDIRYYVVSLPESPSDCDAWVRNVLGKHPAKADVLELREITAAFYGIAPTTPSAKRFAEQQVWFDPKSKLTEVHLSKPRQAVLRRLQAIADKAAPPSKGASRQEAKTQTVE